jgi:hypothetical protein
MQMAMKRVVVLAMVLLLFGSNFADSSSFSSHTSPCAAACDRERESQLFAAENSYGEFTQLINRNHALCLNFMRQATSVPEIMTYFGDDVHSPNSKESASSIRFATMLYTCVSERCPAVHEWKPLWKDLFKTDPHVEKEISQLNSKDWNPAMEDFRMVVEDLERVGFASFGERAAEVKQLLVFVKQHWRTLDMTVYIMLIGLRGSGKSSTINMITGSEVLPTSSLYKTLAPTVVCHVENMTGYSIELPSPDAWVSLETALRATKITAVQECIGKLAPIENAQSHYDTASQVKTVVDYRHELLRCADRLNDRIDDKEPDPKHKAIYDNLVGFMVNRAPLNFSIWVHFAWPNFPGYQQSTCLVDSAGMGDRLFDSPEIQASTDAWAQRSDIIGVLAQTEQLDSRLGNDAVAILDRAVPNNTPIFYATTFIDNLDNPGTLQSGCGERLKLMNDVVRPKKEHVYIEGTCFYPRYAVFIKQFMDSCLHNESFSEADVKAWIEDAGTDEARAKTKTALEKFLSRNKGITKTLSVSDDPAKKCTESSNYMMHIFDSYAQVYGGLSFRKTIEAMPAFLVERSHAAFPSQVQSYLRDSHGAALQHSIDADCTELGTLAAALSNSIVALDSFLYSLEHAGFNPHLHDSISAAITAVRKDWITEQVSDDNYQYFHNWAVMPATKAANQYLAEYIRPLLQVEVLSNAIYVKQQRPLHESCYVPVELENWANASKGALLASYGSHCPYVLSSADFIMEWWQYLVALASTSLVAFIVSIVRANMEKIQEKLAPAVAKVVQTQPRGTIVWACVVGIAFTIVAAFVIFLLIRSCPRTAPPSQPSRLSSDYFNALSDSLLHAAVNSTRHSFSCHFTKLAADLDLLSQHLLDYEEKHNAITQLQTILSRLDPTFAWNFSPLPAARPLTSNQLIIFRYRLKDLNNMLNKWATSAQTPAATPSI